MKENFRKLKSSDNEFDCYKLVTNTYLYNKNSLNRNIIELRAEYMNFIYLSNGGTLSGV